MDKYEGTTVNERLYLSGQMEAFDRAIEDSDFVKIKEILESLHVDEASIDLTIERIKSGDIKA